jgi:hypothetical protein
MLERQPASAHKILYLKCHIAYRIVYQPKKKNRHYEIKQFWHFIFHSWLTYIYLHQYILCRRRAGHTTSRQNKKCKQTKAVCWREDNINMNVIELRSMWKECGSRQGQMARFCDDRNTISGHSRSEDSLRNTREGRTPIFQPASWQQRANTTVHVSSDNIGSLITGFPIIRHSEAMIHSAIRYAKAIAYDDYTDVRQVSVVEERI